MRGGVSVVALRENTDIRISNIPMSNSNDTYFLRHFDMHYCMSRNIDLNTGTSKLPLK